MSGPDLEFPAKLRFLFEPHRFKVAYGGRGGAKSWAFARALLVLGSMTRLRILCTREVQKSIKDSVKRLLDDQIEAMGMQRMYESLETEIRGVNGTEFFFAGLQQHTVDSIKSFEGADLCWIEEAQTVSERSLNILIPTIRKPDSEIWVSFNPQLDTDPVWKRFIENPPTNARVQKVNWNDNPWFPTVLEAERQHCQETDKDNYGNIWEGECRSSVAGAIYSKEIAEALQAQRICPVPYDPRLKVHTIWDLGFNDSMSIILAQKGVSDLRVIGYLEDSFKTLDWYAAELNKMNYNWGYDWLPHDAKAADFKTGLNTHQILKKLGRRTKETPNISIEMGIKAARMLFPRVYFDKAKAARLIECLKRYRRGVPTTTGEPGSPVHDAFSHACLVGDTVIKTRRGDVLIKDVVIGDQVWTPAGWSDVINSGPTKYAKELVEVVAEDGRKLVATPEHKILTQRGFVRADELRYSDHVFNGHELPCVLSTFVSMVTCLGFREAITGEMSGVAAVHQICTERFGRFITEKYLKVLRCITKMAIRSTTIFPTWNAFQCTSINGSTCLSELNAERCARQVATPWHGPLSGIGLQRVKSGIQNTARQLGQIENGMRSLVRIVAKCISHLTLLVPSSATRIASKRLYASGEAKTLVYDLTVRKNACYLANGILVSNCDAFRYLAVVAEQLRNEDEAPVPRVETRTYDTATGY